MKNKIILLLILSLLFIATFIIGCKHGEMRSGEIPPQDTLIIHSVDTVYHDTIIQKNNYIPYEIIKLRIDTVRDTILTFEQKIYNDTLVNEKDTLFQRLFISGADVKLDSTKADWKKHTEIITNTVIKLVEKPKKIFEFKPQVGFGYGVFNKKPDMYIGFGVSIEL
jgi:hypothetical protein